MRAGLLVVVLTGCWSAQPAWTTPPIAVEQAPLPECPIRLTETAHLFVWETDLGMITPDGAVAGRELAIYQTGSEAYVALREPEGRESGAGETLWKVSCGGRMLDTIKVAGADFGHGALHADRRRLFYTHDGVAMMDLTRGTRTQLTANARSQACPLRDYVRGTTRDHVEFVRGGFCGYEGAYDGTWMRRHLASGVEEKSTQITGVIVNDGEIWLAAGDCGTAAIYRSRDWRSWKRFAVPNTQGAITLVSDAPHTVVMATGLCSGTAGGIPAMITRDGGRTWGSISKDIAIEWVQGPDLEQLRAGSASGQQMRWLADQKQLVERGGEWKSAPPLPETLTLDGRQLRPTRFGLYDATTDERLFPR